MLLEVRSTRRCSRTRCGHPPPEAPQDRRPLVAPEVYRRGRVSSSRKRSRARPSSSDSPQASHARDKFSSIGPISPARRRCQRCSGPASRASRRTRRSRGPGYDRAAGLADCAGALGAVRAGTGEDDGDEVLPEEVRRSRSAGPWMAWAGPRTARREVYLRVGDAHVAVGRHHEDHARLKRLAIGDGLHG